MADAGILIAIIAVVGFICQWVGWFFKIPAILFLLLSGMALGVSGQLDPNLLLGDLLFPIVSLSVAIILFEGSLTLNYREIREVGKVVRRLSSWGVVISWTLISLAAHYIVGLEMALSWLLGAMIVVSGPTVIMPMLQSVRPNKKVADILRWEGIVIDPIGAMLAVLVYEYLVSSQGDAPFGHAITVFAMIAAVGVLFGWAAGWLLGFMLRRRLIPHYLESFWAISLVLITFSISNHIEHESGLLAVTVMGIFLANQDDIAIEEILSFKETLSVLLISGLFILLAARVSPSELLALGWSVVALLVVLQFIIRPIVVFACSYKSTLTWQEKLTISWIYPRGIVAAAVSALFALRLEESYPEAGIIVPLTFAVIIGTVLFQSTTAGIVARLLKVAEPSARGILFVGANPVARGMALQLQQKGIDVLLADTSWENTSQARMEGLPVFYGNPISEYADNHLNLIGIGKLVAVSPMRDLNALTCLSYRHEFGKDNIFSIATTIDAKADDKRAIAEQNKGQYIAEDDLTFAKCASLLKQGAKIKTTTLTDTFGFPQLLMSRPTTPLFAIDKKNQVHVFTSKSELDPKAGWHIVSLEIPQKDNTGEHDAIDDKKLAHRKAEKEKKTKNKPSDTGSSNAIT